MSLELTPSGGASVNPLADFLVSTFALYESRLAFGARTGAVTANHDIDNVVASFVPEPSTSLLMALSLAARLLKLA